MYPYIFESKYFIYTKMCRQMFALNKFQTQFSLIKIWTNTTVYNRFIFFHKKLKKRKRKEHVLLFQTLFIEK